MHKSSYLLTCCISFLVSHALMTEQALAETFLQHHHLNSHELINVSPSTVIVSSAIVIQNLPDGDYLYEGERLDDPSVTDSGNLEIILRKVGNTVIGTGIAFQDGNGCFMGEVRNNNVTNVVLASLSGRANQPWSFRAGGNIPLNNFQLQSRAIPEYANRILKNCIDAYIAR